MQTIYLTHPIDPRVCDIEIALAIGYFDGVHLGHQAVIQEAKKLAQELGITSAVMTFDPHPREVLGKANINRYLTPLPEKLAQFAKLGVERTYVMKFDLPFSSLSKEEFIHQVLIPLKVKGVTTGFNFKFGRYASGTTSDLYQLGKGLYQTRVVEPIHTEGVAVSSTRLREAMAEGDIESAKRILGRNYMIEGKVVSGDQRGRLMGFPTANIELEEAFLTPRWGVYVVQVQIGNDWKPGIMNIGVRPTFSDPIPKERLEVHILHFTGNLYGQRLKIEFLHFIREEKKFSSVDALISQIHKDQVEAERWLASTVE